MEQALRRTREKLRILLDTPHMSWILGDMLDVAWEELFSEESKWTDMEKVQLVERLQNQYKKFIKDNEKPNNKQARLEL